MNYVYQNYIKGKSILPEEETTAGEVVTEAETTDASATELETTAADPGCQSVLTPTAVGLFIAAGAVMRRRKKD